jgi:hypothetical protein
MSGSFTYGLFSTGVWSVAGFETVVFVFTGSFCENAAQAKKESASKSKDVSCNFLVVGKCDLMASVICSIAFAMPHKSGKI